MDQKVDTVPVKVFAEPGKVTNELEKVDAELKTVATGVEKSSRNHKEAPS